MQSTPGVAVACMRQESLYYSASAALQHVFKTTQHSKNKNNTNFCIHVTLKTDAEIAVSPTCIHSVQISCEDEAVQTCLHFSCL